MYSITPLQSSLTQFGRILVLFVFCVRRGVERTGAGVTLPDNYNSAVLLMGKPPTV